MAKDDYFVLVNKLLRYLYKCLKQGLAPDWNLLAPNTKVSPSMRNIHLHAIPPSGRRLH